MSENDELSHEDESEATRKRLLKRAEEDEGNTVGQEEASIKRIGEIVQGFKKTRYVYVKQLGAKIPYKPLDFGTFLKIRNTKDNIDLGAQMLFHMLKAADDTVTMEQIKQFPINVVTDMLTVMTGTENITDFLPQTSE